MTQEQIDLFNENKYLVNNIVRKYWNCEREDILQDGYLILCKATERYDKSFNTKPYTYFYNILKKELYKILKKQMLLNSQLDEDTTNLYFKILSGNKDDNSYRSWEDFVNFELYDNESYENSIDNHSLLNKILKETKLSSIELKVINLLLEGLSIQQIYKKLNINEQYCRNVYCNALKKLRIKGEELCTNLKK